MKKVFGIILAAVTSLLICTSPALVYADNKGACENWSGGKDDPNYELICGNGKNNETEAQDRVGNILNIVFTWVAVIAVIVIIIGGILYMTSQGDPGKIQRAKGAILYAVIGLVIVLLAFAIVNFVLSNIK